MKKESKTLLQLISSIRDLASSFASNSEEVRREVTSMSGKNQRLFKLALNLSFSHDVRLGVELDVFKFA